MKRRRLVTTCLLLLAVSAPMRHTLAQATGAVTGTSIGVTTLSTGTVLQVTPAASADRRYVDMSITPQFSTLDGIDTFVVGGTTGIVGGVVGNGRAAQAVSIRPMPFRTAMVGNATFVDLDKPLLLTAVKPMELTGASLKEAIRKLADGTKKNLVLGDRGLEQAGADLKSPHDFFLKPSDPKTPFTMKDALLTLLKTSLPEQPVVITSEDKVITVVSRAQADQSLVTRTYYLEDVLANLPRFVPGGIDLNTLGQPESAKGPEGNGINTSDSATSKAAPAKAKAPVPASTNVLEIITSTVRPEIWKNHGGKSDISMVNDRLTIKAPAYVHALLEGPKVHNSAKVNPYVTYAQ